METPKIMNGKTCWCGATAVGPDDAGDPACAEHFGRSDNYMSQIEEVAKKAMADAVEVLGTDWPLLGKDIYWGMVCANIMRVILDQGDQDSAFRNLRNVEAAARKMVWG